MVVSSGEWVLARTRSDGLRRRPQGRRGGPSTRTKHGLFWLFVACGSD
jgi:hypothetical protein